MKPTKIIEKKEKKQIKIIEKNEKKPNKNN